jgi:pyruvate/2-oxoglutarate dehydrogenase complex dihydrolipoamide dehydrogenase (E3) component
MVSGSPPRRAANREERMQRFDFVVIGAGPAGEAAAYEARERGASVAVIDRDLFGGSCPHWGCIPSKSLLNGAARHAAGADYPWSRASARRDYMINREGLAYPDDGGHVRGLEAAGAAVYRGEGRLAGRGRVIVAGDGASHELAAQTVIVAVGSGTKVPPVEGIGAVRTWTNRDATGARELPRSLLVLGGGPTGVELAQVYARFGVPTVIAQSGPRLLPHDHPRNGEAARQALERDGAVVRLRVRALRARPAASADGADVVELDDGSTVEGHAILLAVGRTFPLDRLGLETVGIDPDDRSALARDGRLRIADGLYLVGDVAGPELHTHQAHYQGVTAVRMALGGAVMPDYRALPRATYTDPELAFVGVSLEQAQANGLDAFELVADFPTTAKGYSVEATFGHVTIVVDRTSRQLIGAAMAVPDASAAIHECVLAIKARLPIELLADTIHAFPSTSRILNGLFNDAAKELATPIPG